MTLNISKVCLEYGVSGLREHEMRGNPRYHRGQNTFYPQHLDILSGRYTARSRLGVFIISSHCHQRTVTFLFYNTRQRREAVKERMEMEQEIFRRYEKKYMITRQQYQELMSRMITQVKPEQYG